MSIDGIRQAGRVADVLSRRIKVQAAERVIAVCRFVNGVDTSFVVSKLHPGDKFIGITPAPGGTPLYDPNVRFYTCRFRPVIA